MQTRSGEGTRRASNKLLWAAVGLGLRETWRAGPLGSTGTSRCSSRRMRGQVCWARFSAARISSNPRKPSRTWARMRSSLRWNMGRNSNFCLRSRHALFTWTNFRGPHPDRTPFAVPAGPGPGGPVNTQSHLFPSSNCWSVRRSGSISCRRTRAVPGASGN